MAAEPGEITGLPLKEARICITGFDHNRPDPFPGLGDFIGWVGGVKRLANGELLFVHSAGYWHVSFATPIVLKEDLVESYKKMGFDMKHEAATARHGQIRLPFTTAPRYPSQHGIFDQ